MHPYFYRHVVTFDETNVVGNVYFVHYLRWQGHCRERFLADHAPSVLRATCRGELVMVTVSCEMQYLGECFALDEIDVCMRLAGLGGNRIVMHFDFLKEGQLVARGTQTVASMRREGAGLAPVAVPAELASAVGSFETVG